MDIGRPLNDALSWARFVPYRLAGRLRRLTTPISPNPDAAVSVAIRYSVLFAHGRGWRLADGRSPEAYRAALFAPERLAERLTLFAGVVLPSLAAQTLPMRKGVREVVLLVSAEMPADGLARLRAAIAAFDWIRLAAVPPDAAGIPMTGPDTIFASVRLDDDDALARGFMARISGYVRPEYAGRVITFPSGISAFLDQHLRYARFANRWTAKETMGMSYIAGPGTPFGSVYHLGHHGKVHRAAPLLSDPQGPMYLRTIYAGQDSLALARTRPGAPVSRQEVEQHFALSSRL